MITAGSRLLVLRLLSYVVLLGVTLLTARWLGPAGRARYALPLNLATIIGVVTSLSLDMSTGGMVARGEISLWTMARFLSAATLVLGAAGFALTCAIGEVFDHQLLADASGSLILLAGLTVPLQMAAQMTAGVIIRLGRLRPYGLAVLLAALSQLAFVVGARIVNGRLTPQLALAGVVVGWAILAIALAGATRRELGLGTLLPRLSRSVIGPAVRGGVRLQPTAVALYLNIRVDLLIVGALTSARETGLYSLAGSLAGVILLGAAQFALAIMKRQTDAPLEQANRYTVQFIRQTSIVVGVGSIVVAAATWPVLRVCFGEAWTPSALPAVILCLAAVTVATEGPARLMLVRMDRAGDINVAAVTACVANVALNFILIPIAGIEGAALASLGSYSLYGFLMLTFFARRAQVPLRSAFLRPLSRDDLAVRLLLELPARLGRRLTPHADR